MLSFTYSFVSLSCYYIIIYFVPNNFLRPFFFSFPSLSSRSGDERERRRNRVFFYFPSLLFRSGDERERERERVIFFSFPSLPFLFCICQPFIIFHSFSNWETKERERGRKIEKKVFFYFPSPRLPTFFHFPSTSKLGDERERESRFFFFSFSSISFLHLPIFYHFPHQDRETKGRKRGREFFSFCSLPFAFYHFPSTSKKRESGREIESFSFIFPPSLPTSYHFPFT